MDLASDLLDRLTPLTGGVSYALVKVYGRGSRKSTLGLAPEHAEVERLFAQVRDPEPDEVVVAVRVSSERLEDIRASLRAVLHQHNAPYRLTIVNV